ncbi:bifunctional UDP-sugar hydrolase/5'-nucleotidase UshA [Vibrio alfacsensis]|uniref:bifunctional UDP-sugar hydrolase/5'-nucleotidase UshA n=1 Tax=Vibrio alfacsensis TaxID=1074311 RepID=UPI002ADD892C|nr:bifunctional UDP-sugar hydrolase/5'-nucleotidase UshA [Vibrio alfacsensis]WQE75162.1 bifunctional UDP-sugar hydrolase/5'-nucleotidase UshA [Vibrio alfacsensis]
MKFYKSLLVLSVGIAMAGCSDDETIIVEAPPGEVNTCFTAESCTQFTILHTNDNHGRFWENKDGEYGMAARKTLIDSIRAEVEANGGYSLLLSGGDINTGVPESDLQDAEPDFLGMSDIGYDAMAVGNHEFDNPLSILEKQRVWANFPMLAANIYKEDGTRYFQPYKVFTLGDLRIAVVGLTTEDTAKIGNPEFISELTFTDPKEEIKKVIQEIKDKDEADLVFATTHMGHYENGQHGSNAPGDVALAKAITEGQLAAVIGGHSQNPVCMEPGTNDYASFKPGDECMPDRQNGTWIMQAHEWGKYVGRADFEYFDDKLHLAKYELIPVNLIDDNDQLIGDYIEPNAELKTLLQEYQDKGQGELDKVIANSNGKLEGERDIVRGQQTNLGRLIATSHKENQNADFAVMNSGGVRASIEAGPIAYRDVLTVQPFGNMVTVAEMTGSEVVEYLKVVATMQRGSGAYAQLTGLEMTVDCTSKEVEISKINGKDFNAADKYKFTVPSFNAAGGDGYPELNVINTGNVDAEVMYSYLEALQTVKVENYQPQGEIVYTNSDSPLGCEIATN